MNFLRMGIFFGSGSFVQSRGLSCFIAIAALGLAACENYTMAPLCHAGNRLTHLPGLDGTYSLSWQDQEFNVTTESFEIEQGREGLLVSARALGSGDPELSAELCSWPNGWIVAQSQQETEGLYRYQRITVGPMGYFVQPIAFDRAQLDASKVPYSVTPVRRQNLVGQLSGGFLRATIASGDDNPEESLGLVVDNRAVPLETMMGAAHAVLGAVAAVRK